MEFEKIIAQVDYNRKNGYMVCNRIAECFCPYNGCRDNNGCSEWYGYDKYIKAIEAIDTAKEMMGKE